MSFCQLTYTTTGNKKLCKSKLKCILSLKRNIIIRYNQTIFEIVQ